MSVQQRSSRERDVVLQKGAAEYRTLKEDADQSAVGAVVSIWRRGASVAHNAIPRLRSGLRLQRCGGSDLSTEQEKRWMEAIKKQSSIDLSKQFEDAGQQLKTLEETRTGCVSVPLS